MVTPQQVEVVDVFLNSTHLEVMSGNLAHYRIFRVIDIYKQLRVSEFVYLAFAFFVLLLGLLSHASTL